jgi:hypothetical protein
MDLNNDGSVSILDFPILQRNFSQTVTFPTALAGSVPLAVMPSPNMRSVRLAVDSTQEHPLWRSILNIDVDDPRGARPTSVIKPFHRQSDGLELKLPDLDEILDWIAVDVVRAAPGLR